LFTLLPNSNGFEPGIGVGCEPDWFMPLC